MNNTPDILFLGTGAADWNTDAPGGRAYASALVCGRILIDCTQRCIARMREYEIDPNWITDVFITHGHSDHFDAGALAALSRMRGEAKEPLCVHLDEMLAPALEGCGATAVPAAPGVPARAAGFTVLPLRANHSGGMPGETPLHYLFTGERASFLYATDGAWLPYESWQALQSARLDAWVTDCTIGAGHRGDYRVFEHNSLEMVRIMAATMRRQKVLKKGGTVLLTHLARTLHPDRQRLEASLRPPFVAAYDGYRHVLTD